MRQRNQSLDLLRVFAFHSHACNLSLRLFALLSILSLFFCRRVSGFVSFSGAPLPPLDSRPSQSMYCLMCYRLDVHALSSHYFKSPSLVSSWMATPLTRTLYFRFSLMRRCKLHVPAFEPSMFSLCCCFFVSVFLFCLSISLSLSRSLSVVCSSPSLIVVVFLRSVVLLFFSFCLSNFFQDRTHSRVWYAWNS